MQDRTRLQSWRPLRSEPDTAHPELGVVQPLSHVWLRDPTGCSMPGLLSFTISQSLLKFMSTDMKTVRDFIFLGSKITADGDYSHEIKRHLLFGRKAMTNLDSMLKCGDITLLTKVHLVKAMVFSVVTYGCESWTIKKSSTEELMLLNCGVGEDS